MADDPAGQKTEDQTFTKEELDKAIKEANAALEAKRDELLGETKAAKEAARKREQELTELQARVAEMEQENKAKQAGITEDKLKEIRAEARKAVENEYGPKIKRLEEAESEIRTLRLDNVVKGTMGKSGVRADRIDALYRLASDQFDLTDDGQPMVKDSALELDKYIPDVLGKQFPEFFEGTGSSGGGAPKSNASGGGRQTQIAWDDGDAFMDNLEGIASGEVNVVQ